MKDEILPKRLLQVFPFIFWGKGALMVSKSISVAEVRSFLFFEVLSWHCWVKAYVLYVHLRDICDVYGAMINYHKMNFRKIQVMKTDLVL